MPISKIDTPGLKADAVDNTILDLASNYAFTGTITGDNAGGFVRVGGGSATGQNLGDVSFDVFSSTYNLYYVQYGINMIADSSQVWMRVRNSSGYKTNAGYFLSLIHI